MENSKTIGDGEQQARSVILEKLFALQDKACYEVTGVKGQILKTSHSHKQSHLCFSDSIRKEL